ncbi:MAG: hypothetical protein JW856_00380 [Dehalococcoidales bacterium]|nr:hypothetical protein [Dehalococcoidales bacterium]
MVTSGLWALAALITGIIAIIKSKERAIPVFVAALLGLFVLIFWLGEFLGPH